MARIDVHQRTLALQAFDLTFAQPGLTIAGMDEVGRGPLAGSVVAACVVMPEAPLIDGIFDSKKLSEKRREALYEAIVENALAVSIGEVSPKEIDRINILNATRAAMGQAAAQVSADIYLIDAVENLGLSGVEVPIIKGDATSYAIAAASIVAKVYRDRQMAAYDALYPGYGFAQHKGYGTPAHLKAIMTLGLCPIHRRSFTRGICTPGGGEA